MPPPAPTAGLARRVAAATYDSLLLGTLALVVGFVLLVLTGLPALPAATNPVPLPPRSLRIALFLALLVAAGAYSAWLWSGGRRTLAMQTWHLALVGWDGAPVSLARACLRYVAWWIGPACAIAAYALLKPSGHGRWALAALAMNYAWALIDRDRQFLHDRVAGTRLVRADRS